MILRVLPASSLWREVRPVEGFAPEPVPNLEANRLGLPGTLGDGSVVYGGSYRTLMNDGDLRIQAHQDLLDNLSVDLPDRNYSGPVFVSFEGLEPTKEDDQQSALLWRQHQIQVIQSWCPKGKLVQYSYGETPEWGSPSRVCRDLYPTSPLFSQLDINCRALSFSPSVTGAIPLVTNWFRGRPDGGSLGDGLWTAQIQTAVCMARKFGTGEIWFWAQADNHNGLALCNAGMARLAESVLNIRAAVA